MNLDFIKNIALSGGDWVVWGLFAASALALGVMLDRAVVLARETKSLRRLKEGLAAPIRAGDKKGIEGVLKAEAGAAGRILASCLAEGGRTAVEDRLLAAMLDERRFLETRLLVLGTLGSNAPFVGLFGTVLGVIRAFHDLAQNAGAGPEVVMRGLSEALIATAVGLFVAIPSVIAYNYLQKKVADLLSSVEAMSRLILAAGK